MADDTPEVVLGFDETSIAAVVASVVEEALKKQAGSLGSMTREDFKGLVYEMLHDQRLITAKNEAIASARIFADIDGFKAAMTNPFRISSAEQLTGFVANLQNAIVPGKTQIVLAVAVVELEKVKPFGS